MSENTIVEDNAISGYLYKKTRDNRWQKRWFETNGIYLTYYKSRKADKLLAALSLPQVGEIRIIKAEEDSERLEGLFSIELNSRIYVLRAKNTEEAQLWVTMLTKLRQEGLQATINPASVGAMETESGEGGSGKTERERATEKGKSEWIKSGRSCLGCC